MSESKNLTTVTDSLDFIIFDYGDFYAFENSLAFELAVASDPELLAKYIGTAKNIEFVKAEWRRSHDEVWITYAYDCDDCHENGEAVHRVEVDDKLNYKTFSKTLYKLVEIGKRY